MFNIESGSNKAFKNWQYCLTGVAQNFFGPIQHVAILLPDEQIRHQGILNSAGKLKLKVVVKSAAPLAQLDRASVF